MLFVSLSFELELKLSQVIVPQHVSKDRAHNIVTQFAPVCVALPRAHILALPNNKAVTLLWVSLKAIIIL